MSDPTTEAIDAQAERLRKHAGPVDLHSVVQPGDHDHFATYKVATIALRDAELALKAAQEVYRRALEALNKAIAPFPQEAR